MARIVPLGVVLWQSYAGLGYALGACVACGVIHISSGLYNPDAEKLDFACDGVNSRGSLTITHSKVITFIPDFGYL